MVVGEGYRFGYRASGDTDALRELGGAAGLRVVVADLVDAGASGADGKVRQSDPAEERNLEYQMPVQTEVLQKGSRLIS